MEQFPLNDWQAHATYDLLAPVLQLMEQLLPRPIYRRLAAALLNEVDKQSEIRRDEPWHYWDF